MTGSGSTGIVGGKRWGRYVMVVVALVAALLVMDGAGPRPAGATTSWSHDRCGKANVAGTTVPARVYWMDVVVVAASGGRGGSQASGDRGGAGAGGQVIATLAVTPGTAIFAVVGCPGVNGRDSVASGALDPVDGWSRGGGSGVGSSIAGVNGATGGTGGGASALCIGGTAANCSSAGGTRVVVAGGGGGGGASSCAGTRAGAGGGGGIESSSSQGSGGGRSGGNGTAGGNSGNNSNGGGGGSGGINSVAGSADGGTSANGSGGLGVNVVGGGGGGGFRGGAAGSGSNTGCKGGGGGGGGSSWVRSTAINVFAGAAAEPPVVRVVFADPEDRVAPTVTVRKPANNATFVRDQVVLADFECADDAGGSGLAGCTGPVADGAPINTSTLGSHTFAVTGVDQAGNVKTVSRTYTVVDRTKPTVTVATPVAGGVYGRTQVVAADYTCADEAGGSGLASCSGPVADGAPIDTSSVGARTFTVVARDGAANTQQTQIRYTVAEPRPDLRIRRQGSSVVKGDGIRNATGVGQTVGGSATRGGFFGFVVGVRNDAPFTDSFVLSGIGSNARFKVDYFAGADPVTDEVVAGTYRTPPVAPDATFNLRVRVKVRSGAPAGAARTGTVTARSATVTADLDTVGFISRVR